MAEYGDSGVRSKTNVVYDVSVIAVVKIWECELVN